MFDLNVLPINLWQGRNLGKIPGLKIYTAPKKCEKSRQYDILIILMTPEGSPASIQDYEKWGAIISDGYFTARGSFTMGITAASKKIRKALDDVPENSKVPLLLINYAILRDKTLLIGHAGPVNTTIIYADHIDNFTDESSMPVNSEREALRFFQAELHAGDMVLMTPKIPNGWTNDAILEATSESPLNVLRYLFNQANGNLQSCVIQVKAGRGLIRYRYKPPIQAEVKQDFQEEDNIFSEFSQMQQAPTISGIIRNEGEDGQLYTENETGFLVGSDAENPQPLFRLRMPHDELPGYMDNKEKTISKNNSDKQTETGKSQIESDNPPFLSHRSSKGSQPATVSEEAEPVIPPESQTEEKVTEQPEITAENVPAASPEAASAAESGEKAETNQTEKTEQNAASNHDQEAENHSPNEDISENLPEFVEKLKSSEKESSDQAQDSQERIAEQEEPAEQVQSLPKESSSLDSSTLDSSSKASAETIRKESVHEKQAAANFSKPSIGGKIRKVILIAVCVIVIPALAATVLFSVYKNHSRSAYHTENLQSAVDTAQTASQQTVPSLQIISWNKVLEYLDAADQYGSSQASRDLRAQAYKAMDNIMGGRNTEYKFALAQPLTRGIKISRLEASAQYIYALDSETGSILRFNRSGKGLILDSHFDCRPGTYPYIKALSKPAAPVEKDEDNPFANDTPEAEATDIVQRDNVTVTNLVDFVMLPNNSGMGELAAIDKNANILYCSDNGSKSSVLGTPDNGKLNITRIIFYSSNLYLLDSADNSMWVYGFQQNQGFYNDPDSYFGGSAPDLQETVDFQVLNNYSWFLRNNGSLIYCDYTGYTANCQNINTLKSENGNDIDLERMHFSMIKANISPDNSIYVMDNKLQTILNLSLKMNLIRYITPNRDNNAGQGENVTAFTLFDTYNVLWASGENIYMGSIP